MLGDYLRQGIPESGQGQDKCSKIEVTKEENKPKFINKLINKIISKQKKFVNPNDSLSRMRQQKKRNENEFNHETTGKIKSTTKIKNKSTTK